MPTPSFAAVASYRVIQYTGSNSADIDAAIPDLAITSEGGGTLHADSGGSSWTINTNDMVVYWQGYINYVQTPSTFDVFWVKDAILSDLDTVNTALDARLDTLEAGSSSSSRSVGLKESPTLLLGQSATVAVDIIPAMPNSSYTPYVQLVASTTALGSLSVTGVSVVDADTVNVTVQNSGLVNLSGVHILVVAKM